MSLLAVVWECVETTRRRLKERPESGLGGAVCTDEVIASVTIEITGRQNIDYGKTLIVQMIYRDMLRVSKTPESVIEVYRNERTSFRRDEHVAAPRCQGKVRIPIIVQIVHDQRCRIFFFIGFGRSTRIDEQAVDAKILAAQGTTAPIAI